MKKLSIQLSQKYKSFENGFTQELNGDLIILSGVNGSGKTQLIDVIQGRPLQDPNGSINRDVTIDEVPLSKEEIVPKSFRDHSSISELTQAVVTNSLQTKNQLWDWYKNDRLNYDGNQAKGFRQVRKEAKSVLVKELGQSEFDQATIDQDKFNNVIPPDFVLFQDDIFTNKIGEIFFAHVSAEHNGFAKAGKAGAQFDPNSLPKAPWLVLNELFSELNFDYRFKDHYQRNDDIINEQPSIFGIDDLGKADDQQRRSLSDLSDGEKAIISLTFAVIASGKIQPKLLLLDEYDATLNPSLTRAFFTVIKRFFVDKGTQVVIATHSSTTLSLAPDDAVFYEIYRPKSGRPRMLQVNRDAYEEMKVVHQAFYSRIENQSARIAEVEEENNKLQIRNSELSSQALPFLFVEGEIDTRYIIKASSFNETWKELLEKVVMEQKEGAGNLYKYWQGRAQIKEFPKDKVILLFDCDTKKSAEDDANFYKRSVPFDAAHSIKVGIENLLPDDLIKRAESAIGNCTKKSIPDTGAPHEEEWTLHGNRKTDLCDWVCENATLDDLKNFKGIFDILEELLKV